MTFNWQDCEKVAIENFFDSFCNIEESNSNFHKVQGMDAKVSNLKFPTKENSPNMNLFAVCQPTPTGKEHFLRYRSMPPLHFARISQINFHSFEL